MVVANSHKCFKQHQYATPRSRVLPAPLESTPALPAAPHLADATLVLAVCVRHREAGNGG